MRPSLSGELLLVGERLLGLPLTGEALPIKRVQYDNNNCITITLGMTVCIINLVTL